MKFKIYLITALVLSLSVNQVVAWGTDVEVSTSTPNGATSVVANSAGTLYASAPEISLNPTYALSIYESVDNGATWQMLNIGAGNPGQVVRKSKMLVTSLDEVVCLYQLGDSIYTLQLATGISTAFTTILARDFDAVASFSGSAIYLFIDQANNKNLRRYSSTDAGLTWTGSTGMVSGDAAFPRVYMSGTRLFLTYYGPTLSDTLLSVVRTTNYDETSPGTLVSNTTSFQDIITNTSVSKNQVQVTAVNGTVWIFWTEGVSPSVLKCRVSITNGSTFGAEFVVAGSASTEVRVFDSKHYINTVTSGVQIAYFADSLQGGAPTPLTDRIEFTATDIANAQTFFTPQTVSEGVAYGSTENLNISLVSYFYNFSPASGVLWVQATSGGDGLYYDASSSTVTGVNEIADQASDFSVFPNPASSYLIIRPETKLPGNYQIELYDVKGSFLKKEEFFSSENSEFNFDVSDLSKGVYYLNLKNAQHSTVKKIVILD